MKRTRAFLRWVGLSDSPVRFGSDGPRTLPRPRRLQSRERLRPVLERLEDRTLMSVAVLEDPDNAGKFIASFDADDPETSDNLTLRITGSAEVEYQLNGGDFTKVDTAPAAEGTAPTV